MHWKAFPKTSWRPWRSPVALGATSVAVALCVTCAAHPAASASPAPHQVTAGDHTADRSAGCGSGGAGGRGGDSAEGGRTGRPGEPGKPATHACTRYADLPDKPKDELTVADKVRVVLVLINGGATKAQIAKKYKMPEREVETWKKAYQHHDWSVLLHGTGPATA